MHRETLTAWCFWEAEASVTVFGQKRRNVAERCSRLMMWREIFNLKSWKTTAHSEAVSARTLWFVIWVRQLLLAQQVKPLQLITAHSTTVVCPVSQTPVARPLRKAHCLKMSPQNTVHLSTPELLHWCKELNAVHILSPLGDGSLLLHLPQTVSV